MPEDTLLWSSWATKDDVNDYFVEGCEISDEDFLSFIDSFQGDWEYVAETMNDIMSDHEKNVSCSECGLFDYKCVTDEKEQETLCRHCGEAEEVVYQ